MIIPYIIKFILPTLIICTTALFLFMKYMQWKSQQSGDKITVHDKIIFPLKLQALERIVLFLERMHPNQLLSRIDSAKLTVVDFQNQLIDNIRNEYEHNLSQQIYMSNKNWSLIKTTKEEIIKLIHTSAAGLEKDAPAFMLSKKILEEMLKSNQDLVQTSIDRVKSEFQFLLKNEQ